MLCQNRLLFLHLASCSSKSNYSICLKKSFLIVSNFIFRYVEFEHIRHCVPSNVSSGLANLPLKYVWLDGKENTSWPTDPYLPTGEALNGSRAYSQIMSYFTTNAMTPMDVHELGKKQLSILYPMVSLITFVFHSWRRYTHSKILKTFYVSINSLRMFTSDKD